MIYCWFLPCQCSIRPPTALTMFDPWNLFLSFNPSLKAHDKTPHLSHVTQIYSTSSSVTIRKKLLIHSPFVSIHLKS